MSLNFLKHILNLIDKKRNRRFTIPYGRHSYGPQPDIIGTMPFVRQKARGSKVGNFCSIAPGLRYTFLGKHNYEHISTYPFYEFYE